MTDYLWLVLLIILVAITALCFFSYIASFIVRNKLKENGELDDEKERVFAKIFPISGILMLFCGGIAYKINTHLILQAPEVLVNFAYWYGVGLLASLVHMFFHGYLLHPYYSTDWDEVFAGFFKALLGPIQIIFTVWGILKYKPAHK